jgi:hypothetical protein
MINKVINHHAKKLNEEEVKEQYLVTITNKFADPENLENNGVTSIRHGHY